MTPQMAWQVELGSWPSLDAQRKAAYGLLCHLVGSEPRLEHTSQGAPYLPAFPALCVSISHCDGAVAVAVRENGRVGIDVECRRRVSAELMRRVCNDSEWLQVQASSDPTWEFLHLWTRKEAVLKHRGTGIRGFGSLVHVLEGSNFEVRNVDTGSADVVCGLCV